MFEIVSIQTCNAQILKPLFLSVVFPYRTESIYDTAVCNSLPAVQCVGGYDQCIVLVQGVHLFSQLHFKSALGNVGDLFMHMLMEGRYRAGRDLPKGQGAFFLRV